MDSKIAPSEFHPSLDLFACYRTAWLSFRKGWIPLCVIAAVLLLIQEVPKFFIDAPSPWRILKDLIACQMSGDLIQLEQLLTEQADLLISYGTALSKYSLYAAPIVALISIVLLYQSLAAVKNSRAPLSPIRMIVTALAQLLLTTLKMLLLFFILPLGLYIYAKLCMVSFLMLDEKQSLPQAVQSSWRLTQGNVWKLLALSALNTGIQLTLLPSLIGLIPATGFIQTTRAAAFQQLRPPRNENC